jgi:hypothetical protein
MQMRWRREGVGTSMSENYTSDVSTQFGCYECSKERKCSSPHNSGEVYMAFVKSEPCPHKESEP